MKLSMLALAALLLAFNAQAQQNQQTQQEYAYFAFDPDITTNFIRLENSRHLGYVRVAITAMVSSTQDLDLVEHHAPLLRDAFVRIFSETQEGKVRSLTGRDELRRECTEKAKEILRREVGREVIHDIIFTSYIYE